MELLFRILLPSFLLVTICYSQMDYNVILVEKPDLTDTNKTKVNLTVFYEAMEPQSKAFFSRILSPVLCAFRGYTLLEFRPMAKSMNYTDGQWLFNCSGGEKGCESNKYQACALNLNTTDNDKVVFVLCLMKSKGSSALQMCSTKSGIPVNNVTTCGDSDQGGNYLSNYTQLALNMSPPITHTPALLVDGVPFIINYTKLYESLINDIIDFSNDENSTEVLVNETNDAQDYNFETQTDLYENETNDTPSFDEAQTELYEDTDESQGYDEDNSLSHHHSHHGHHGQHHGHKRHHKHKQDIIKDLFKEICHILNNTPPACNRESL